MIPSDFSRRLHEGRPAQVQFLVDGSFPMRAEVVRGYVTAINAQFNQGMVSRYLSLKGQTAAAVFPISVEGRAWYNPSLESKNFIIPGLLVITLMFYPALLAALVVVREKESGTIYNLYCSPVRPWEVVAGKAIPYIGVAFINYVIIFLLSVILFKVRFIGSFPLLTAGALLYIACTIGIGLVIRHFPHTDRCNAHYIFRNNDPGLSVFRFYGAHYESGYNRTDREPIHTCHIFHVYGEGDLPERVGILLLCMGFTYACYLRSRCLQCCNTFV